MEKSFRVIWELDVDAPDAVTAAKLAKESIVKNIACVFEVHEWDEPDMVTATPVGLIDVMDPDADLPKPSRRVFEEQYLGPGII
jgi:hypothetical protein